MPKKGKRKEPTTPEKVRPRRRVKRAKPDDFYTFNYDIPGIEKIVLTDVAQRDVLCLVGEHVTSENPWVYVEKDAIEYNIALLEDESEFIHLKEKIETYPRPTILIGYIPDELRTYDEFYICLTESATDEVQNAQDEMQRKRKERLETNIYKYAREWKSLGSEPDVQDLNITDTRLRIEMEVEANYPFMAGPLVHFSERRAEDVEDAADEFLSEERDPLLMISKRRLDNFAQAAPEKHAKSIGTLPRQDRNEAIQYHFEGVLTEAITDRYLAKVQTSLKTILKTADDEFYVASSINFYKEDYVDLINENDQSKTEILTFKEYTTFFDTEYCMKKVISAIAWHPMWSGTVAIAYSDIPSNHLLDGPFKGDEVHSAVHSLNPVLIWSLIDGLKAKLLLLAPREISCLAFSPYNENVLVGGSVSGQVFMWDLTNRFEDVDSVEILTADQTAYRNLMNSLMDWMKNVKDLAKVPATVVSDIVYSHKESVCSINWLSPFWPMSKKGRVTPLDEGQPPTALQFITASSDGTIMIWDISLESAGLAAFKPKRRLRRLKRRPSTLTSKISAFKGFDKILRPMYQLIVAFPLDDFLFPVTSMNLHIPLIAYELQDPNAEHPLETSHRTKYKPVLDAPACTKNEIIVGTGTGHVLSLKWDGYDYSSSDIVPKEHCMIHGHRVHDGPVVAISRSKYLPDLYLSVGGKVFAIWSEKYPHAPLLWRRCRCYYTHGIWYQTRPTIFKLTRSDGNMEMWQVTTSTSGASEIQQISGKAIMCSLTHRLPFFKRVHGVAEYNGSFRLFAYTHAVNPAEETAKMRAIIDKEIDRKLKYREWCEQWMTNNAAIIEERKRREAAEAKQKADQLAYQQMMELEERQRLELEEAKRLAALSKPQPGKYLEFMERLWHKKELERMNQEFFMRRSVNKELLDQKQAPLMRMQEQVEIRQEKVQERHDNAQKTIEDSIALYFPEVVEVKPPPPPDPYAGGDSMSAKLDILKQYDDVVRACRESVKTPHPFHYNWLETIQDAEVRRRNLLPFFSSENHLDRMVNERIARKNQALQQTTFVAPKSATRGSDESMTSGESITAVNDDGEFMVNEPEQSS